MESSTFRKANGKLLLNIASLLTNRCVQVHQYRLCCRFHSRGRHWCWDQGRRRYLRHRLSVGETRSSSPLRLTLHAICRYRVSQLIPCRCSQVPYHWSRSVVPSKLQSRLHGWRWDDPRRERRDNLVPFHIARHLVQGERTSRSPSDFERPLDRVELAETGWPS